MTADQLKKLNDMDWIGDFADGFCYFPEIRKLKAEKFHGSLTIDFSDGRPMSYALKVCRRNAAQV